MVAGHLDVRPSRMRLLYYLDIICYLISVNHSSLCSVSGIQQYGLSSSRGYIAEGDKGLKDYYGNHIDC
jgi:hypothetical protein